MKHNTHLQSSDSIDTNSYQFDEYGNVRVGTPEDLLFDKFLDKSESESCKVLLNLPNQEKDNNMNKPNNSVVSLSSYSKGIQSNLNENDQNEEKKEELTSNDYTYDYKEKNEDEFNENVYENDMNNILNNDSKNGQGFNRTKKYNNKNNIDNNNEKLSKKDIVNNEIIDNNNKNETYSNKNIDENNRYNKNNKISISSNTIEISLNGNRTKNIINKKNKNIQDKRIVELNVNIEYLPNDKKEIKESKESKESKEKNNNNKKSIEYIKKELERIKFAPKRDGLIQKTNPEKEESFMRSIDNIFSNINSTTNKYKDMNKNIRNIKRGKNISKNKIKIKKNKLLPKKQRLFLTKIYKKMEVVMPPKDLGCYISKQIGNFKNQSSLSRITVLNGICFYTKQLLRKGIEVKIIKNIKTQSIKNKITAKDTESNMKLVENYENDTYYNISKLTKNKSKRDNWKNLDKYNKDELYTYESSAEYKENDLLKQNKMVNPHNYHNFVSLSNEKFASNKKKHNKKLLTDLLFNKKNMKNKNINSISPNWTKKKILSSLSGTSISRLDCLTNKPFNMIMENNEIRDKSLQFNNKNLGLPVLNINNNILLRLKNAVQCGKFHYLHCCVNKFKKHYGNEDKCPACISMTMKQNYIQCQRDLFFNEEKINDFNSFKNRRTNTDNLKKKHHIKYKIIKHIK